jgi:ABC-type thiamine transport system ATPase subunit
MTKGQTMQYDIQIDNTELIAIIAALGKQKATFESLKMFEAAHQISDILAKLRAAVPAHSKAS